MPQRSKTSSIVSLRHIAEQAGVSNCTASRVLNGKAHDISIATRERVSQTARQMGYSPNRSARALVTGRTHLVAMLVYRLSSPYVGMLSQQMQEVVNRDGYELIMREFGTAGLTLQSSVDGIMALDPGRLPLGVGPKDSASLSTPYVFIGTDISNPLQLDRVNVELEDVARQATQHLIGLGRRRIAHVTSKEDVPEDSRCEGYRSAMAEAGLATTFLNVPEDHRTDGFSVIEQCIAEGNLPDALFCRNDELAFGCLRALYKHGRSVPEDVAVIGCDGVEEGAYGYCSLSTINLPVADMCRIAWQFLRQRIEDPRAPQQVMNLRSSMLLRESA